MMASQSHFKDLIDRLNELHAGSCSHVQITDRFTPPVKPDLKNGSACTSRQDGIRGALEIQSKA